MNINFPENIFEKWLADYLPKQFLCALKPIVASGYEEAKYMIQEGKKEMPYRYNVLSHWRNMLICEHLHEAGHDLGVEITPIRLDNGYSILEIRYNNLTMHIKHFNTYETLVEQVLKADYRKQKACINRFSRQQYLFGFEPDNYNVIGFPRYVVIMYGDSVKSRLEAGNSFFVLPNEHGEIVATAYLDNILEKIESTICQDTFEDTPDLDFPSKQKPPTIQKNA